MAYLAIQGDIRISAGQAFQELQLHLVFRALLSELPLVETQVLSSC